MGEIDIYQHFRKEERTFIDKMTDLAKRVQDNYVYQVTDFLDPRRVKIAKSVSGQMGLTYYLSTDFLKTEYAKIILAPDYYELELDDFEIALLEISYNPKFNHLTHSQIMGSFINKLGLERSVFGDIILADNRAQILVKDSMVATLVRSIKLAELL